MSFTRGLSVCALLLPSAFAYVMPDGYTGKLPTLGWNSWNAYHCDVDEDKVLAAAQALIDSGLRDAGYNYVNIDDCWSEKTGRVNGHIIPNTTSFPDGISGLAEKIHSMNLKMGIYSTAGNATCAGYPASLGYETVDATDFASWGIDYLKYDNCNVPQNWTDQYIYCTQDRSDINITANGTCTQQLDPDLAPAGYNWEASNTFDRFARMRDALAQQDREILFSLCIWGYADVFDWGNETGISWRMSGDIEPYWNAVTRILNINSFKMNSTNFWGHNDADMLEVGNGNLTFEETRSHFAFWAAMKSPLLIGTDLTNLSQTNIDLLKNEYLLAFSQDTVYGAPATPYKWGANPDWTYDPYSPAEYWAGASQNGTLVLMLNPQNETTETKEAIWSEIPGLGHGQFEVTDVWTGRLNLPDDKDEGKWKLELMSADIPIVHLSLPSPETEEAGVAEVRLRWRTKLKKFQNARVSMSTTRAVTNVYYRIALSGNKARPHKS
ncbi:alpha-glucosidase maltase [Elasticomyces elasticus]|uniref:Alpha-galactosidase n=1 Tax=Exophiala sideris TaxID=1016849 RepID=A0ABR0JFB6_9EURO|nr:alpha-glucosidase maltase [Elasticomyces elasticus]KAK5025357.1 alpha-glucosidase maltase [Exophiala sideris]KAK5032932.1 alpha-glucosidase maltase [Exophiala sideris]KAK5063417.1 alpha-glucosidase maltase [Exophiala sideris]